MRKAIKKKANFDIMDLDTIQVLLPTSTIFDIKLDLLTFELPFIQYDLENKESSFFWCPCHYMHFLTNKLKGKFIRIS